MWRLVPALVREMGQAYPELHRAEALITETLKLEEIRFRKTLERGLSILDDASKRPEEGRHVRRRDRFHALRHVRLSRSISPRTRCARAASASTSLRSPMRWSASAQGARVVGRVGRGCGRDGVVRVARKARRHRFSRLRDRDRRRRRRRAGARRQGGRRAEQGRERRGGAQPDAVLRRVRRPGWRHRHDDRRRRALARDRHAKTRRRCVRAYRHGRGGQPRGRPRA